ncbi:MAG: hypothetical protein M0P58_03965 [Bacteroidales bacterium]|nr:hypothetical protein [Bacteroidales bacterium]
MRSFRFSVFFIIIFYSFQLFSQVNAQWRGPERSDIYPGKGLLTSWPEKGPALLWPASDIGKGYSSAVCDGNAIYVTGMKDSSN